LINIFSKSKNSNKLFASRISCELVRYHWHTYAYAWMADRCIEEEEWRDKDNDDSRR